MINAYELKWKELYIKLSFGCEFASVEQKQRCSREAFVSKWNLFVFQQNINIRQHSLMTLKGNNCKLD